MSNHTNSKGFLIGAAVGSVLGTVSALLIAPKSGKRLRHDLADLYCDACDTTHDIACKLSKKGKSLAQNLSSQTTDWKDKAKDTAEHIQGWMECDHETAKDLAIGGAVGSIIGVITGLLLAPKAGSELREDIAESYEDLTEKTQDVADQLTKKGKRVAKNVQSQASDWIDTIKDLVERFTDQAEDQVEEVKEKGKQIGSNRLNDVMELASLGFRLWQGRKRGR